MNQVIEKFGLRPGDEIIIPKSELKLIQHHALYIGQDPGHIHWIVENKLGQGVRLVSANEFFAGLDHITDIQRFQGSDDERKLLVDRALKSLGKPYDLIKYNCEHFTSELTTGLAVSKQVGTFVLGALGLLVISAWMID